MRSVLASRNVAAVLMLALCLARTGWAQQLAFELPNPLGDQVSVQVGDAKLTVICFLGTQCPMAKAYAGSLSKLQQDYAADGVRVLGVMSNRQDSVEDIRAYVAATEAEFDIVVDRENRIADRYGATRTPEAYLLDEQLKLRYHGRIDDQYSPGIARASASREDLRAAIDELLAGKPVSIRETLALGCIIGRMKQSVSEDTIDSSQLTFHQDVYPMLQQHCIECHRRGEIGPFAMDSYDEVVGWADTMLETMDDGRMPPWHADPMHGSFANARFMPTKDKELFRDWIASGAAEGRPPENPAKQDYVSGWQLGREPDLVLPMRDRPFTVPKDGVVEYQYFVVDPKLEEDKWITAAQVIPGSSDVVHHVIVFVRPPDDARFRGFSALGGYVPGQRPLSLPTGYARLVPAGSKFVFQIHYTPVGTERDDITHVGLLFADESEVTHSLLTLAALDQEFEIPPNTADFPVTAALSSLPPNGTLLAVTPHMHVRGKSFELHASFESGYGPDDVILLRVPNYDFNWQHTYQFAEPIAAEKLKQLRIKTVFDNSAGNPYNPDPDEWVTWGDQTWEEMALGFFEFAVPKESEHRYRRDVTKTEESAAQRLVLIEDYIANALRRMDANGDGVIRKSEADIIVRRRFWQWDKDQDSVVTRDEIRQVAESLF